MEYLGAKIDIDISQFVSKVDKAIDKTEELAKTSDEEFKKIAESMRNNLENVGKVDMSDTISSFKKNFDDLDTYLKSKKIELPDFGAKEELGKLENNLSSFYINEEGALKRVSRALDEYMKNDMTMKERLGFGGFKGLLDMYKDGNMSAKEFLDTVDKVQKKFKGTNTRENGGTEESARAEKLSRALKELKRNKEFLSKVNGSSVSPTDDSGAGDAVEKTGKKLSTFGKLVTRVAGHLVPRNFRYMFTAIRGAIGSTGVGALILAVIGYIKMLYEWNKKLIGLKWGDMKDSLSVMMGYMSAEDASTQKVLRRTDAIEEQTKAIHENIQAQIQAKSILEKAEAAQKFNLAKSEAKKEVVGANTFHFLGGQKDLTDAEFFSLIKDVEGETRNIDAVKRYFQLTEEEIQKLTAKELEEIEFEYKYAIARSNELTKREQGMKNLEKLNDAEKASNPFAGIIGLQTWLSVKLSKKGTSNSIKDAENSLKTINEEYDKLKDKGDIIAKLEIKSNISRELSEAQDIIAKMELGELGGESWSGAQGTIDESTEKLRKYNDLREYELSLIKRRNELRKQDIANSGAEMTQTKILDSEIKSITEQLNYLRNNGVDSVAQRRMVEDLQKQLTAKQIERENTAYKEQVDILSHILGLKTQENTIRGLADSELRNIDLEIDNIQRKLAMLGDQKNLSAEEKREMGTLSTTLAVKRNEREDLALKKHNEELDRQADIKTRLLRIEKERNGLYENRNGRTDEEIERENLKKDIQIAEREVELAQQRVDSLQAQKEQSEESDDAIRDGVQWTHEEQKALEEANVALQEKTVALQKARDAEANYQGVVVQAIDVDKERVDALHAMADGFSDIGSAISDNLGNEKVGDVADAFADLGNVLVDVYGKWKQGDKVTAGDKVSAISKGIEFVAGQASGIVATHKRLKESAEAWKQSVADVAHEYTMIKLADMEYKQQNVFGVEDPYKRLADNAKKYEAASKATRQALEQLAGEGMVKVGERAKEDWGGVMGDALAGAAAGAGIGGIAGGGVFSWAGAGIGAAAGFVSGFITGIFKDKEMVDVFDTLQNKFGEVFDPDTLEINDQILASYDQLDDKTQKLVDNYKELKEKMDEASEEFKQFAAEMFGDIGNALADSLLKAFRNDDLYQSVHDFHDYVKQQMETLISSKIYNAVFGRIFDNLDSQIESLMANFNRGEDVDLTTLMADLPYQTEQLVSTYGALMKQVQEASRGTWDFFQPDEMAQDALRGSIASMSEDTASKLNGNFMGLKLSAMEINTKMTSVRDMMEDNQAILGRSLSVLQQIAGNTAYLLRIDERLNYMQINGIKVV